MNLWLSKQALLARSRAFALILRPVCVGRGEPSAACLAQARMSRRFLCLLPDISRNIAAQCRWKSVVRPSLSLATVLAYHIDARWEGIPKASAISSPQHHFQNCLCPLPLRSKLADDFKSDRSCPSLILSKYVRFHVGLAGLEELD